MGQPSQADLSERRPRRRIVLRAVTGSASLTALPPDPTRPDAARPARRQFLQPAVQERCRPILGVAHYIIHAYDAPPLAPRALDAARRYASISAPAATMQVSSTPLPSPSPASASLEGVDDRHHRQFAEAGGKAARPGRALARSCTPSTTRPTPICSRPTTPAKAVRDHAITIAGVGSRAPARRGRRLRPGGHSRRRPGARGMERREGGGADRAAHPAAPYTEAITHFAQASARPARASGKNRHDRLFNIQRLAAIRPGMLEMKDAYWAEQVDIQRRAAADRRGRSTSGRQGQGQAFGMGGGRRGPHRQSAVTPGPIAPARELLGLHAAQCRPAEGRPR